MHNLLRNKIVLICLAFLFCQNSNAQNLRLDDYNLPDHDYKPIRLGINLGLNRSYFKFTHHPIFIPRDTIQFIESLNRVGLNLALLVNFNISEHFDIRTFPLNLTFTEKTFRYGNKYPDRPAGESDVLDKKVQSISMTFPVQLKFSSDRIGNFKVYMLGGVKAEYDMASNAGARKADNLIKLNKFDYGVDLGIGFHFYYPMFVLTPELKFGWGLGNLHARDEALKYSNTIDKINSRSLTFSLTVE
jgi:hypothetical protein